MNRDGGAMLTAGDAHLMLDHRTEALVSYRDLTDKYPYLNNNLACAAQDRIDSLIQLDVLRTDLNTFPPHNGIMRNIR